MIRYATLMAAAVVLSIALSACASQPAHFYTLNSAATLTAAPLAVSVSVGPVSIPAIVDNSTIMASVGASEIRPEDFARWAAPLRDGIAHAVAGDLAALLGTERVTLSADTWSQTPDYRVAIEVERFESAPGQAATLDAVWTVRGSEDHLVREGRTTVREETQGADMGALAAAHSRALVRLSADIAQAIRSLSQSTPAQPRSSD
jgi:uncharacterized protein